MYFRYTTKSKNYGQHNYLSENEKQKSLLKSLLEEMKVHFEVVQSTDKTLFTESEFYEKIDRSIAQAEQGDRKTISKEEQRALLGL